LKRGTWQLPLSRFLPALQRVISVAGVVRRMSDAI
jgi:hypothetical protein